MIMLLREILFIFIIWGTVLLTFPSFLSGQNHLHHHRSDLYDAIERKFEFLDAFTKATYSEYTDRKWGIASMSLYNQTKTRFMFDHLLDHDQHRKINTICELGFNAGHSSLLFLETIRHAKVYSFDLGDVRWSKGNSILFSKIYGDLFTYVLGDSMQTISNFLNKISCDVVFADGAKDFDHRYGDVKNFRNISYPGALVFMDEICHPDCASGAVTANDPKCKLGEYYPTTLAYNKLSQDGILSVKNCVPTPTPFDEFCLGVYSN